MRALLTAVVIATTGLFAAGCGGSDATSATQASTAGVSACQAAINDVFDYAEANATTTDASMLTLFVEVAFSMCRTSNDLDRAIGVWLDDARSRGKDVADSTASEITGQRELLCSTVPQGAPRQICG